MYALQENTGQCVKIGCDNKRSLVCAKTDEASKKMLDKTPTMALIIVMPMALRDQNIEP